MNKIQKINTLLKFSGLCLLLSVANPAFSDNKMPIVLKESKISDQCKAIVIDATNHIIGPKKHRIIQSTNNEKDIFEAFILLGYNDQESHVTISAVDTNGQCLVSSNESFEIDISCVEAREGLFKRWALLGNLSSSTRVMRYDHPRKKITLPEKIEDRATAYLTQTRQGASCLITKRQHNIQIMPVE